jgi:hypothetical protein
MRAKFMRNEKKDGFILADIAKMCAKSYAEKGRMKSFGQ